MQKKVESEKYLSLKIARDQPILFTCPYCGHVGTYNSQVSHIGKMHKDELANKTVNDILKTGRKGK